MKIAHKTTLAAFLVASSALFAETVLFQDNFDNEDLDQTGNADWFNGGLWDLRAIESGTTLKTQAFESAWAWTGFNSLQVINMPAEGMEVSFTFDMADLQVTSDGDGSDARIYIRIVDAGALPPGNGFHKEKLASPHIGMSLFPSFGGENLNFLGEYHPTSDNAEATRFDAVAVPWDTAKVSDWIVKVTPTGYSMWVGETEIASAAWEDTGFANPFPDGMYASVSYGNLKAGSSGFIEMNSFTVTEGDAVSTWAGYPIEPDGVSVDTEDFMGWVDTTHEPYIYIYSLSSYAYAPEAFFSDQGAWMYLAR